MNHPTPDQPSARDPLALALGVFSLGLGLAELLAPKGLAKLIGVKSRPGLFAALGLREIASGIGILSQRRPTLWMWSRVAGDVMDLSLLGTAWASEKTDPLRLQSAAAAVAGVTVADVISALQLSRSEQQGIHVQKSVIIERTPEELYWFWRDLENLPKFMRHLETVRFTGEKTSHWEARAVAGKKVSWDAEIINEQPGELIAWRSLPGAEVAQAGTVHFERNPQGKGTFVRVNMQFYPPGGFFGAKALKLFGGDPAQQVESDLYRLRNVMESGHA